MTEKSRTAAPVVDHAENFVDLDDLDLAGVDVEEIVGGVANTYSCSGSGGGSDYQLSDICVPRGPY
ncbi:hypothetical protein ABZ806_04075 [Spirillospora sp. NPDC047418]|jgi:hypothetical protein